VSSQVASLADVRKCFGPIVALDDVSFTAQRGELLAVLGHNGAGKSTAISLLLGLLRPDRGAARLFNQPATSVAARQRVGVMMQDVTLAPELRVREHLALFSSYYPRPHRTGTLMEQTRTTALADRPYGALSGGQKRLVQFSIALCGDPELVFLDEPTAGLDVETRAQVWSSIRGLIEMGRSVVLTTHYLEEAAALASRVAVLAGGRLRAVGSVDDVRGLVDRTRVTCKTSLSAQTVRAWPGVESVAHSNGRLCVTARDGESLVRRLLTADASLRELEVQRASLADALADLTTTSPPAAVSDPLVRGASR
jgi:ABC-2 type transport system ATP-binding protein